MPAPSVTAKGAACPRRGTHICIEKEEAARLPLFMLISDNYSYNGDRI